MVETGMTIEQRRTVLEADSIKFLGADVQPSLSTPSMIHWMEISCRDLAKPHLDDGQDTVGVSVNVQHLAASPMGAQVIYRSTVEAVEGRKIRFQVEAIDGAEVVGRGSHERFVIDVERFAAGLRKRFEGR